MFAAFLAVPAMPVKPQAPRGIDLDAQGVINGQPTYEYDMANAYKDDEKPWKKPGAPLITRVVRLQQITFFQERISVTISTTDLLKKHGLSIVIDNVVFVQKIISLV